MEFKTADLCDEHPGKVQVVSPIGFKDYGGKKTFSGKIYTVKCFEDNSLVRKALEGDGTGRVLVVDGGASMRCALLGDMLGELAVKNKWNGIIVYGCIRDWVAMERLDLGVKALNTIPLKSQKRNEGQENIEVSFGGASFIPAQFVYCDVDGIIVSAINLSGGS
jgi:regulator of ribonuclease activity A